MMSDTKQRLIVVLGMHRSGTSALARGLLALGVDLGNHLMPAIEGDNEKGFWEDLDVNGFNIELMDQLGVAWDSLQLLGASEFERDDLTHLRTRALELLRTKIRDAPVFGIKDPRTARLLPFWQSVFEKARVDAAYVIALRHPMSVASSLKKRDGFEDEKSYYLWLNHMVSSIVGTVGSPRLVVSYDSLMDEPTEQLRRIAVAFNLSCDFSSVEISEYLTQFLEHRLRHTCYQFETLQAAPAVPREIIMAYSLLEKLARDELPSESPHLEKVFDGLAQRLHEMSPALSYMSKRDRDVAERDAALQRGADRMVQQETAITLLAQQKSELSAEITDLEAKLMNHSAELAARDTAIAALKNSLAAGAQETDRLRMTIGELKRRCDGLADRLVDTEKGLETLMETIRDQEREIAHYRTDHERLTNELSRLGHVVESQTSTLEMISGTAGWLVTRRFRTIKDAYLFVPGSRRRRVYDVVLRSVKRRFAKP